MADNTTLNAGILNNYVINPKDITSYKARRGIMDFTQLGMFDQYETGYSFLSVLAIPEWLKVIVENKSDEKISAMVNSFKHMLEYEFRGLSGLSDVTAETMELTDGANSVALINNVTKDTSVTVSMNFFERRGSLITRFAEYYLTGIKDPYSKAKTYHGLIADGKIEPGLDKEVFTFLYYVTDNTMMRLEKAVLLTDCQLTKAETSMYDSERGQMGNKELTIEFNTFPITGYAVDKAANYLLADITGVEYNPAKFGATNGFDKNHGKNDAIPAELDSAAYKFGIMDKRNNNPAYLGVFDNVPADEEDKPTV